MAIAAPAIVELLPEHRETTALLPHADESALALLSESPALSTALSLCLHAQVPMVLVCGEASHCLYNDACIRSSVRCIRAPSASRSLQLPPNAWGWRGRQTDSSTPSHRHGRAARCSKAAGRWASCISPPIRADSRRSGTAIRLRQQPWLCRRPQTNAATTAFYCIWKMPCSMSPNRARSWTPACACSASICGSTAAHSAWRRRTTV